MTGNDEVTANPRQNSATPANGSVVTSTAAAIAVVDGGEELQTLIDEMRKQHPKCFCFYAKLLLLGMQDFDSIRFATYRTARDYLPLV